MAFVLDASIAGCWAFDDEDHPTAFAALERLRTDDAMAPSLLWFEVRNLLLANERRGRIDEATVAAFLRRLTRLPIVIDREPDEAQLMALARRHRLTVYDAAYLELAQREDLSLATLDTQLAQAARAEGIGLIDPGAAHQAS